MQSIRVLLLCPLLLLASYSNADTLTGKAVKIADGDTVTVLDAANPLARWYVVKIPKMLDQDSISKDNTYKPRFLQRRQVMVGTSNSG